MEFLIIISAFNYPFHETQFIQGKALLTVCNAVIPSVWGLNICYPDSLSASLTITVNTFIFIQFLDGMFINTLDNWKEQSRKTSLCL